MKKIVLTISIGLLTLMFAQPDIQIYPMNLMGFPLGCTSDGSTVVGTNSGYQAITWTEEGGEMSLGSGEAWGISDNGIIVGERYNDDMKYEAAYYEDGEWYLMGNVPDGNSCDAFYSHAKAISDDGSTIVGMGWADCHTQAYKWTQATGGMVSFGNYSDENWQDESTKAQAISADAELIGGWVQGNARWSALWDIEGNLTLLGSMVEGENFGEVMGINGDGSKVVGYTVAPDYSTQAYIWTEQDGFQVLGIPQSNAQFPRSLATAISDNDIVVGNYLYAGMTDFRAAIYTEELGEYTDLKDYLQDQGVVEAEDWTFLTASFISRDGTTIGGYGYNEMALKGFVIKLPPPEEIVLGDVNNDGIVNVNDIVLTVGIILETIEPTYFQEIAADTNEDGVVNVLDILVIIDWIINPGGADRVDLATSARLIRSGNELLLESDGKVGAVQVRISHDEGIRLDVSQDTMVADYVTKGTESTIILVAPESELLFTADMDFVVEEITAASGDDYIDVHIMPTFALLKSYPNPFNPMTNIQYALPQSGEMSLAVYDMQGRLVEELVSGIQSAGSYSVSWNAGQYASGIYLLRLQGMDFQNSQKLVLVK